MSVASKGLFSQNYCQDGFSKQGCSEKKREKKQEIIYTEEDRKAPYL